MMILKEMRVEDDGGEQAATELFQAVGRAITAWSFVEQGLTSVFGAALGPSLTIKPGFIGAGGAIFAVFYAIENQRTRIAMIDAALNSAIREDTDESKEVHKLWKKAKARTQTLGAARNRLAHWYVSASGTAGEGHKMKLLPPFFDNKRAHQGVALHDVVGWEREFRRLAEEEISPLVYALGRHRGLRKSFANGVGAIMHNLRVDGRDDEADEVLGWLTNPV